jgi:hypothetical protein
MATLGDILAMARNSAGGLEAWLVRTDPDLARQATLAAHAYELGLAGYARMAVGDFSRLANEEDWTTLLSSLRDSADPGATCLAAMVHWRLSAAICAGHSSRSMEGVADDG